MSKKYFKRFLEEEIQGGKSIRILDPESEDYSYEQWALMQGPGILDRLGIEPRTPLVIERHDPRTD